MSHNAAVRSVWIAAIAVSLFMILQRGPEVMAAGSVSQSAADHPQQQAEPISLKVVLERVYLDGEMSEETIQEPVTSLADFWAKYDQWELLSSNETALVFRKQVDDISPLSKANGYFGVTDKGILTIFNGKPGQARIIQSFFQIDIKKLESYRQKELFKGIPVKTKDRYIKVLETFKPYSTGEKLGR
ncbi:BofC C-terminal domain-containing protein [Neobacillus sp. SM06]|uniref:BofC C-terminal domain-containing protein n=1 Tax=Neobacillus sp. SM06 TaxID=3422492 RepID=UPI003D29F999